MSAVTGSDDESSEIDSENDQDESGKDIFPLITKSSQTRERERDVWLVGEEGRVGGRKGEWEGGGVWEGGREGGGREKGRGRERERERERDGEIDR